MRPTVRRRRWGTAVVVLVVLAGAGLPACGRGTRSPAAQTAPRRLPAPAAPRLAIGLSENNPLFVRPGAVPVPFVRWRDAVAALHPARYRLFVDWSTLQPDPARPADLAQGNDGCLRGLGPCGAFAGVRDRLRAVAARQRADGGGWALTIVVLGVPPWAAVGPHGCERPGTAPRSRPISDAGLRGYRALIRDLLALGRAEGVLMPSWSPWNEPNQPTFISPQRTRCAVRSPTVAPATYARLVRAARAELAADPAPHELVLGELAGYGAPTPRGTGISEFVRALPDDVACAGAVWAQHEYAQPGGAQPDAVGELERVLDERRCTAGRPIWVTETGVGGARAGLPRPAGAAELARQCAAQAALLETWDRDPQVGAAFQFSVREDTAYPVGLVDARLQHAYPTFALWRAWGTAAATAVGPPPRPPGCGAP